jgi:hypothetical protein
MESRKALENDRSMVIVVAMCDVNHETAVYQALEKVRIPLPRQNISVGKCGEEALWKTYFFRRPFPLLSCD